MGFLRAFSLVGALALVASFLRSFSNYYFELIRINLDLSQPQMCSPPPPGNVCVGPCIYGVSVCAWSVHNTAGPSRSTQTIAEEMAPVRARPQSTAITFSPCYTLMQSTLLTFSISVQYYSIIQCNLFKV